MSELATSTDHPLSVASCAEAVAQSLGVKLPLASPLGVIMLKTSFPRPIGDIGNAASFPFKVHFAVADAATVTQWWWNIQIASERGWYSRRFWGALSDERCAMSLDPCVVASMCVVRCT